MHTHKDGHNNRVTTLIHSCLATTALRSTNIPLRFNGRTRHRLPIACTAPRPCSTYLSVPPHTNRGSLNGILRFTLLFTAFVFKNCPNLSRKSATCQQLFFCCGQMLADPGDTQTFYNFLSPFGQCNRPVNGPRTILFCRIIADWRTIVYGNKTFSFQMHQDGTVFL